MTNFGGNGEVESSSDARNMVAREGGCPQCRKQRRWVARLTSNPVDRHDLVEGTTGGTVIK